MGKVIHLSRAESATNAQSLDASCLAFSSMSEIRCSVASNVHSAASRRGATLLLRTVAQMLVQLMIAQPDKRITPSGLSFHNAGRRAIELLELAQELDDDSATKEGA